MGWKQTITTTTDNGSEKKGSWKDTIQEVTPEERGLLQDVEFPGKGLVQGSVNALPIAGAVGGGFLGAAGGPVGAMAGAGLGGAGGEATKNALNRYLFGEKQNREQIYGEPVKSGLMSAVAEGGGMNTLAKNVAVGGLMGASEPVDSQNLGDNLTQRGLNAVSGGAKAGLIHAGVNTGLAAATKLGPKIKQESEDFYVRSLGARPKFFEDATDQKVSDVAKFAKDKGIVSPGDSINSIADKAYAARQKAGQNLGSIYKDAQGKVDEYISGNADKATLDKLSLATPTVDELKAQTLPLIQKNLPGTNARGPQKAVEDFFDGLKDQYGTKPLDLQDLHLIKSNLQKEVDWSKSRSEMLNRDSGFATASRNVADKINDHMDIMDQVLKNSGDSSLATQLKEANKEFSLAAAANTVADKASGKARGLNRVPLTDAILGAGAMKSGEGPEGIVKGLGIGVLSKAARSYGSPITASVLDKASSVLNSWPAQKASQAMQLLKDTSVPDKVKANLMNRMISGQ